MRLVKRFGTRNAGNKRPAALKKSCAECDNRIGAIKRFHLRELAGTPGVPRGLAVHALREAEALAWSTGHPCLFYPSLAEEKMAAVHKWTERQQKVLMHGANWY